AALTPLGPLRPRATSRLVTLLVRREKRWRAGMTPDRRVVEACDEGTQRFARALSLARHFDFDLAIREFDAARRVEPLLAAPCWLELAEIRRAQGRFDDAKLLYARSVHHLAPGSRIEASRALRGLAFCGIAEGDIDAAIEALAL